MGPRALDLGRGRSVGHGADCAVFVGCGRGLPGIRKLPIDWENLEPGQPVYSLLEAAATLIYIGMMMPMIAVVLLSAIRR
jgi:hypothetical protein